MAASARPYVTAASAAGYHVLAADVFGDEETRAASTGMLSLAYGHGGFTEDAIRDVLIPSLVLHDVQFLLYGSGFEATPYLLDVLARQVPVLGNTASTIARCKSPLDFYSSCLTLDIPVPDTRFDLATLNIALADSAASGAEANDGWLCKRAGGSGGMHVTTLSASLTGSIGAAEPADDVYFQRRIEGEPVSLLFLAHKGEVHVVGFQRQLVCPYGDLPYRFSGLVGPLMLAPDAQDTLVQAAGKLTAHYALRGLNSLDAIMGRDGLLVLEINPRLSASLALYGHQVQWLQAHIASCQDDTSVNIPATAASGMGQVRANLVCYSPIDLELPAGFAWPPWVVDRPPAGARIEQHMPLCTIMAMADDDVQAEGQALERARVLNELLNNIEQSGEESHESISFGYQPLA